MRLHDALYTEARQRELVDVAAGGAVARVRRPRINSAVGSRTTP